MSFDINILVNGNRCKQYWHDNKCYVEAKQGSEYSIEIKNNYWKRILSVCSVDGLNVLSGKSASPEDTGYIIDSYHSEKIKGFRFSNDEWAIFKFGYKFNGKTYAQSKQDGSEKNCGVVGVKLFYEDEPPAVITNNNNWYWNQYELPKITTPYHPPYWTYTCSNGESLEGGIYGSSNSSNTHQSFYCSNSPLRSCDSTKRQQSKFVGNNQIKPKGFDMGTEWGRKETSKVQNVSFERGRLAHSLNIYYASRESLIQMGVPIHNEIKVNLPQSFPNQYAQPPKGWQG